MNEAKTDEREEGKPGAAELAERLREFVGVQLREGAEPSELSFVLAYVATEMGLAIAPSPISVFPVVLDAVAKATQCRMEAQPQPEEPMLDEVPMSANRTLH